MFTSLMAWLINNSFGKEGEKMEIERNYQKSRDLAKAIFCEEVWLERGREVKTWENVN